MTNMPKPYHLTIFGATGFTGTLVVQYLASKPISVTEVDDFKWAIAGRDRSKLEQVRKELGLAELPILVADSHDPVSLRKMCAQTNAIISTVGPYAKHGMELVGACVAEKTHYADLSGEVTFMRRTIDAYHKEAKAKGVQIVHSCGFDSVPSEMGVHYLQTQAKERFGEFCGSVQMAVLGAKGSFSGGTFASLFGVLKEATDNPATRTLVNDPYGLNPIDVRGTCETSDFRSAYFDKAVGKWLAPFVMGSINTRIVRRGEALLGQPFGKTFCYEEAAATGKGFKGRLIATLTQKTMKILFGLNAHGLIMKLLQRFAPDAGEGPDEEERENGYFKILFVGRGPVELKVLVRGKRDPGYGCTSRMLVECGILLATGQGLGGGVLTPRVALGDTLLEKLPRAGVTFEVVE